MDLVKTILTIITLFFGIATQAQTYYVANSGDDNADGLSESTAWKTLDKINAIKFPDNSSVLFKKGDVFRGKFSLYKTPVGVKIGSYGTGENPKFKGSIKIENWTKTNNNAFGSNKDKIWEADVSAIIPKDKNGKDMPIYYLFADDDIMTLARYPNVESPRLEHRNWSKITKSNGGKSFNCDEYKNLKANGYWNGANLRVRNYSWTMSLVKVSNYTASSGNFTLSDGITANAGWGFYLDNKMEELDYPGEWYYDSANKKLYYYPKNNQNPNNLFIEGSVYPGGMSAGYLKHNTEISNIDFLHYLGKAIDINKTDGVKVYNCNFNYNGGAITLWCGANAHIYNNNINNSFNTSIGLSATSGYDIKNTKVENNIIKNNSMLPGYGVYTVKSYNGSAMRVFGKAFTVRYNTIENCGWTGIYLKAEGNHIIEKNIIKNALLVINDGGGIAIGSNGNKIRNNIISGSIGNTDESNGCGGSTTLPCSSHSAYGMGIGSDNTFKDNVIENNVIFNNTDMGIRLNTFRNTVVKNNIVYNNDPNIVIQDKNGDKISKDNIIENNQIISLNANNLNLSLTKTKSSVNHGTFKNNFYANPSNETIIKFSGNYNLAHWQNDYSSRNYGQNSRANHVQYSKYNITNVKQNLILNSTFDSDVDNWKPSSSDNKQWDASKTGMDGGSLKIIYTSKSINAMPNTISIENDKLYRLSFSVIANNFGDIKLRFNDLNESEWTKQNILESFYAFDTKRKEYETFIYADRTSDNCKLYFMTDSDDANIYWLDNVKFEEVVGTKGTLLDSVKLFTNSSNSIKIYNLGNSVWNDIDGKEVTTSVNVQPWYGKILFYKSGKIPDEISEIKNNHKLSNHDIKIYPNPAKDYFTVESDLLKEKDAIVEIYSITGKKITTLYNKETKNKLKISVNNLNKGMYFIVIRNTKQTKSIQLIIN